jgi:nicotinate-nucleotide adenylyltransferase
MNKSSRKIGIFSGTFDPIHEGHVAFCAQALRECGLDKVFLLVEKAPRFKQPVASYEHRISMVELALTGMGSLQQLQLAQEQFSVSETLPKLKKLFAKDELWLLMGSDTVHSMSRGWPGLETLLSDMGIAVGLRQHETKEAISAILDTHGSTHYKIFASPHRHVASSLVRSTDPKSHEALNPLVAQYISEHSLY